MTMKISSGLFICEDVLINPFMADLHTEILSEPTRDLLRTPFLADQRFDQDPGGRSNPTSCFLASAQSKLVSLFGSAASLPTIASQFSADRGFVNPNKACNLRLVVSCFQKYINLVSLVLGKLLVDTHNVPVLYRCQIHDPISVILPGQNSYSPWQDPE